MEESRNSDTTPETADTPAAGFYVVGIGASAGGLAALRTLFSSMPASPGIACVVVVHLSPEHESHLVPLLQPYTQMPVQQVTQTLAIEPNHVYVIPPNANLNSIDTHLRLSQLEERRVERAPIDHFLRTLATTHDGASIGVILTGAGSDGALGLRQIKEHGGLTVAQDPQEAEYDSMPRNAIATGMVEVVAPLRDIPAEILRFCTTQPRLPAPDADGGIDQADAVALENIIGILERRTGRDFHVYTHAILLKRIRHRMQVRHLDSLGSYLDLLHEQHQEAHELSNDLLLTVTEFFREPEVYEQLQQRVLPGLLDRKQNPGDRLRVWSIGCSTGEEAYSLAMLAMEQTAQRDIHPHLQIFASDLADEMLHRAREGAYPREVAASVSAERLERFFTKDIGYYGVRREVRDAVVFASHNLFKDPPYSHLDLIVCRNLLRDLQPDIRIGVIRLFHYALEPHGLLVLGPGDDAPDPDLFVPEVAADGIYRRRTGPRRPLLLPAGVRPFGADHPYVELPGLPGVAPVQPHATVHRQAIEPHTPASVLVDAGNKIVHFSSRAWTFLRIPGGELTHDVVRLAQQPLRSHLEDGLVVVRKERRAWMSPVLIADTDHGPRHVVIRVEPIRPVDVQELVLVIFDELLAGTRTDLADAAAAAAATAAARLGVGLERTNQKLRVLVGQTEGGRTDDAAEAGGLDSNELRTVMEELESSREELQAVNEELLTVDRENRRRIEQLAQLSNDLHQLLQSTGIATLFLDTGLRIVRFTPPIAELFNVRVGDIGRSLSDFTHGLLYDDLIGDARRVQETDARLEREVEAANGRWYLARMLPYQMEADQGDGVVLTLVDITERRRAEEELREADRRKDEFLAVLSHELRNPLAPIASGIELLKSAGRDDLEIVERVVPMMARQVRHLVRLVDDLLESRASAAAG